MEAQISKLKNELQKRVTDSTIDLNEAPPECQQPDLAPQYVGDCFRYPVMEPAFQQGQDMNTLYVIPICSNPSVLVDPSLVQDASMLASAVSKPHPRYPNPGDIWPSQILEKHP